MTSRATRLLALASATVLAAGVITPIVVAPAAQAETVYTLQDVQKHGTAADCWSIVGTSVYNLTTWIPRHEGGQTVIIGMCGIDGTATYMGAHGPSGSDADEAASALSRFRIGAYDTASANFAQTTTYTMADVAKHATPTDCWSVVTTKVYNLTNWVKTHPGGSGVIAAMCGRDGTASYNSRHASSGSAAAALKSLQIGVLTGGTGTPTTTAPVKKYTLRQVRKHRTAADCWTVVGTTVYDVTSWIAQHPGGKASIVAMCGRKATAAFRSAHGTSASAKATLAGFKIGKVRRI
jgi:cytochrome b involved in lipid metabolism